MNDTKPWYLSRTIWASLVTILLAVAGYAGIAMDGTEHAVLTDAITQAVTALAGIIAIFGRLRAKAKIG